MIDRLVLDDHLLWLKRGDSHCSVKFFYLFMTFHTSGKNIV
jgi:hypothetical protein